MRTLTEYLSGYAAYHRDRRNLVTHFVGIPMIVLAVTTLLARPHWPLGMGDDIVLTPAMVVYALACVFYLRLSAGFGIAMVFVLAAFVYAGHQLGMLNTGQWWLVGGGLFVLGWIIQFVGHYYEGRKPAFVDDLAGLLIGPLFLVAETAFALGLARHTRQRIAAGDEALPRSRRV